MFLPEKKEREYRFRLALRMGLPIFALMFALIFHTVITNHENLTSAFYIESLIVLIFGIYFIFYLIYSGFESKITDDVSKVFTRNYLYKYINKELKKNEEYTLILISVDNLNDINNRYGIKTGDKILYEVGLWICTYFQNNNIFNFPIGHVKGGDFIIGLKGNSTNYLTILELMCLKADEFKIDDIEVKIEGAIFDKYKSNDLEYMIENLFDLKEFNKHKKENTKFISDDIQPNELESYVINAIKHKHITFMKQSVYNKNNDIVISEYFVKLKRPDGKYIHQKSYIKILNKLRLMVDYDYMILEKCIKNYNENDSIVAISISPTSIRNRSFLNDVHNLMDSNPHIKNKIMFILSEQEYFSYSQKYNDIINNFRRLGIKITIDKFGSYHSSFLYFKDLQIDALRVASNYTKDIASASNIGILNGFITMAKQNNTAIWMKMIENKQTFDTIKSIDVDYYQGKYLSELKNI